MGTQRRIMTGTMLSVALATVLGGCAATPTDDKKKEPSSQTVTVNVDGSGATSPNSPLKLIKPVPGPLNKAQATSMTNNGQATTYPANGVPAINGVNGYMVNGQMVANANPYMINGANYYQTHGMVQSYGAYGQPAPYTNQGMWDKDKAEEEKIRKRELAEAEARGREMAKRELERQQAESNPELIKITAIGYGSESTFEDYTMGQRRLMAIRSSKLDAYRSLAEQINGIKIDSNTSLATLTAKNDSFRARVNAVVRGARVISVTPLADHNYETVIEVYVTRDFFNQAFVYSAKNEYESGSKLMEAACSSELNCVDVSDIYR